MQDTDPPTYRLPFREFVIRRYKQYISLHQREQAGVQRAAARSLRARCPRNTPPSSPPRAAKQNLEIALAKNCKRSKSDLNCDLVDCFFVKFMLYYYHEEKGST